MARKFTEIGVSGGAGSPTGFHDEEFLPGLRGHAAIRKYREMRENDPIIGAIMTAMDMMMRGVTWRVVGPDKSKNEFVKNIMTGMEQTWDESISEALTMLTYGYSLLEIVYKRLPTGEITVGKLAPRAQYTIDKFDVDDKGNILGVWQVPRFTGTTVYIPIAKLLHFRTVSYNNAPAGRSVLRNAYLPYYYATHIQTVEAIAIERELNGLPIGRVPAEYLAPDADEAKVAFINKFKQILRDVKKNEQGYIILPSDLYEDDDGKLSDKYLVDFNLVASNGSRDIRTGEVIIRNQQDMARTVLADFVLLGQNDRGSFALSKSKTDLFLASIRGHINNMAEVFNRQLLPRIWALNGWGEASMPRFKPGRIAPVEIEQIGRYIKSLTDAKIPLSDEDTANYLRELADLPEPNGPDVAPEEPDPVEPPAPAPEGEGEGEGEGSGDGAED